MSVEAEMNDFTKIFIKINKFGYYLGLPPMWKETALAEQLLPLQHFLRIGLNLITVVFILMEWFSYYTQVNLSKKQHKDQLIFAISHPLLLLNVINVEMYSSKIEELLNEMIISLKLIYNDKELEREAIRKSKIFSAVFCAIMVFAFLSYCIDATQVVIGGGTFTTIITSWPDVHDYSLMANIARVLTNLVWFHFLVRISGIYILVNSATISVSQQFTNLQSYFYSLHAIFEEHIPQNEKEEKYEQALILGIQMHVRTLW
ncbi:hypothetical protein ACJJTC_014723 [Scirpophaga incertulas]